MATRQINVDRLVKLATFLAPIKEEKFDLDSWGNHEGFLDEHDVNLFGLNPDKAQKFCPTSDQLNNACGTTACALGWAGTIPEFQNGVPGPTIKPKNNLA